MDDYRQPPTITPAHIDAMRSVCATWPFDKFTPIALLRDVLHHLEALQQVPVPVSDAPSYMDDWHTEYRTLDPELYQSDQ